MRSPTAKEKARAASVAEITGLLQNGPMSAHELAQRVTVHRSTLYDHLDHMHQTLRIAHPTGRKVGHSMVWALGTDPTLQSNMYREQIATTKRDPLVAALFGPATR